MPFVTDTEPAFRKSLYKNNGRDFVSQRKYRNEEIVEIRKAKKEDQFRKRRNINNIDDLDVIMCQESQQYHNKLTISEIKSMLQSNDINKMIQAVKLSRSKLTKLKNPPIENFFENGFLPLFVETLSNFDNEELIYHTIGILTNIAYGEIKYSDALVNAGAIPILIKLLSHSSDRISEQSIWTISNITGNSAAHRDNIIKGGIVPVVKQLIIRFWDKIEILRNVCWLISNLFRDKSKSYPINAVLDMLPMIGEVMIRVNDIECNIDLTYAVGYACAKREEIIDGLIEMNIHSVVISNLNMEPSMLIPSLRLLGNIVAGTNKQTEAAIKCGLVELLTILIKHNNPRILKETCWIISNISAGTSKQIQILIDSGLILGVLNVMMNGDYKSQKEAAWVVSNMITNSEDEQKYYLLNNNVFDAMIPIMSCDDVSLVTSLLDSIKALFESVDNIGELELCVEAFENAGGLEKIENLQYHVSNEVYSKSYEIVKEFFGNEEDEENEENMETEAFEKYNF